MRIVYVGNYRHPWTTETHVAADAERIPGVQVLRMQEPSHGGDMTMSRFLTEVEHTASECDLLIYQRTWGLPNEATDLWRRLEARGCWTASYHLDLYVGLERERTIVADPFWSTGTVFTADGDPATQEWMHAHEIAHVWLPAAIATAEVNRSEVQVSEWVGDPVDVVFVGSAPGTYHHEWPWRGELLDGLARRYGRRFRRFPTDNRRIHGATLSALYETIPVVVGDSLSLPGHRNYWSDRFYETVGRAGYLIGPNVPGIEQHFTSGEHLDLYELGDLGDVYELIDQALADPEVTRSIARSGREHVRAHHTYTHRVREMLMALGLFEAAGEWQPEGDPT